MRHLLQAGTQVFPDVSTRLSRRFYRWKRGRIYEQTLDLLEELWNTHSGPAGWDVRQRNRIVKYAIRNCSYYRSVISRIPDWSEQKLWEEIPLLTKDIIRKNRNDLTSRWAGFMGCGKFNTGGSTGEPLEFVTGPYAYPIANAHQEFVLKKMGYHVGDGIACFNGVAVSEALQRKGSYWTPRIAERSEADLLVQRAQPDYLRIYPYGEICYSTHYLSKSTICKYIEHIDKRDYAFWMGYPSPVYELAKYISEKGITLSHWPKAVQLTSEMVDASQLQLISEALKCRVYLQYGHSEACLCAHTYDNSFAYVCSPFPGYLEVVDESGRHVRENEAGEVIVTGYGHLGMPFIRYRTGDRAEFHSRKNGLVKLTRVLGRTQDYFITSKQEKISVTGVIFGQHFRAFRNIEQWQIIQDAPGQARVLVVPGEGFGSEDEVEIYNRIIRQTSIAVSVERVSSIPLTSRGKRPFFVQNVRFS